MLALQLALAADTHAPQPMPAGLWFGVSGHVYGAPDSGLWPGLSAHIAYHLETPYASHNPRRGGLYLRPELRLGTVPLGAAVEGGLHAGTRLGPVMLGPYGRYGVTWRPDGGHVSTNLMLGAEVGVFVHPNVSIGAHLGRGAGHAGQGWLEAGLSLSIRLPQKRRPSP